MNKNLHQKLVKYLDATIGTNPMMIADLDAYIQEAEHQDGSTTWKQNYWRLKDSPPPDEDDLVQLIIEDFYLYMDCTGEPVRSDLYAIADVDQYVTDRMKEDPKLWPSIESALIQLVSDIQDHKYHTDWGITIRQVVNAIKHLYGPNTFDHITEQLEK